MIKQMFVASLIVFIVSIAVFIWGDWEYLGNLGTILGIATFAPVIYAIWSYIQYIRLEKKALEKIRSEPGVLPVVLIVDVGGASIRNDVEAFLRQQDGFQGFDFDGRVFVVHRDSKHIQASDVDDIIKSVEEKQNEIRAIAADKIHLFMKVPIPLAAMVGEVLANSITTIVYHKQRNTGYENWGTLHR